jgi:hypothetical protein
MTIYRKIYEDHYGPIPEDENGRTYEIHHKDGNHNNNDPKNLKAVSIQEHYNIHYQQEDWLSCLIMSERMGISVEEKSILCSRAQKERISKRNHRFLDKDWQKEKYYRQDLEKRSEISRRTCEEMVKNKTHPFLGGDIQREAHKRRKETGNYLSGEKAPMFGKKHGEEAKKKMRGPRKPLGPQSEEHKKKRIESFKRNTQKKKD